jgi:hypothetical protein
VADRIDCFVVATNYAAAARTKRSSRWESVECAAEEEAAAAVASVSSVCLVDAAEEASTVARVPSAQTLAAQVAALTAASVNAAEEAAVLPAAGGSVSGTVLWVAAEERTLVCSDGVTAAFREGRAPVC